MRPISQLAGISRIFSLPWFLLISCCLLSSCSSSDRIQGYIYYRLNYNPTTLDPAEIVDVTGGLIAAKIFNGLVMLDDKLNVIPDIAESWSISPDGTTYTFQLKKRVYFSNNKDVKASDFKYSFKRVLDPKGKSPNTWVLENISGARLYMQGKADDVSGITVLDPHTLQITLEKPFSPFLNLLTMTAAYVVPEEEVRRRGKDFATHPVGSGPFMLREWKHNNSILLEKNNGYFDEKAKIEGIVYRIIPEDLTAVTEFELGNLDVISIPASEYRRFRRSESWKSHISSMEGINTYYLGFNCSRPPFNDPRVRKAVSQAIDRKKILDTFYEGRGSLAQGPVPDMLRMWEAPEPYAFNPDAARLFIQESGLQGKTIWFFVTADQEVIDIAEIIQSYLDHAGLAVKIKQLEWSSYKAAINNGEADMFWISWWADYPDPENFLFPLFHSANHGPSGNRTRYTNISVDALIESGQTSLNKLEQYRAYEKAEKIITEEAPWVFFWHKTELTLRQPAIRNYRIYPIYSIDKGLEVSF
jgi:peptide/nickel transport system substrate-binding protein/oligopeptide transport system substrate-binding protein